MTRERLILGLLLAATFAIRAFHPDQPIVENYVGRQIPTAMVARNLERGRGFFRPQLDTGPFPNLFLVEPPIYAQMVASIRPLFGFDLEATGRLVSAAATTLAAWGLFGLARRRESPLVAFLALASFSLFPVEIRYGRAFQPDALMLGCLLAGLRGWDEFEATGHRRWAAFGGFVFSMGLALKITSAWALIPFLLVVGRWPIGRRISVALAMLGPALGWYLLVWEDVASPQGGSSASADNAGLWFLALSPASWLRFSTYDSLARGLVFRSFTPIGFVLACGGLLFAGKLDRLWRGWAIGCGISILILASKWHHAYYWMVVAPLAAIGVARGLVALSRLRRPCWRVAALGLGSFFLVGCLVQSISTWRTPPEWTGLIEASEAIGALSSENELVIAPEALLYYSDRPGFRLEFDRGASRRAAGEWGHPLPDVPGPLDLAELYRKLQIMHWGEFGSSWLVQGGTSTKPLVIADVGLEDRDPGRRTFRAAIRGRLNTRIVIDRPDLMVALLR